LLDQLRDTLRVCHCARRTEDACVDWVKRFILFHHKRHPKEMGAPDITAFPTHLALEVKLAASTQTRAVMHPERSSALFCSVVEGCAEFRSCPVREAGARIYCDKWTEEEVGGGRKCCAVGHRFDRFCGTLSSIQRDHAG
jgi:hypothetical protein